MTDASFTDDEFDTEAAPLGDDEYVDEPEVAPTPSAEELARAQGWRPGKRTRDGVSLTPEEFLARGEEEIPILRHNNRLLTEKVARQGGELETMRRTLEQQAQAIKDGIALAQRADERGYARAVADLKAQQRSAVATGDTESFEQAEAQLAAMESERAKIVPPAAVPEPQRPQLDSEIADFMAAPPVWYADPVLATALRNAHAQLVRDNPGVRQGELLEDAINEVAEAFPGRIRRRGAPPVPRQTQDDERPADQAARPRARQPASVLTPNAGGGGRAPAARDPFSRIPEGERAEAKAAFQRQSAWGEADGAKYVALYLGERNSADVAEEARGTRRRGGN